MSSKTRRLKVPKDRRRLDSDLDVYELIMRVLYREWETTPSRLAATAERLTGHGTYREALLALEAMCEMDIALHLGGDLYRLTDTNNDRVAVLMRKAMAGTYFVA